MGCIIYRQYQTQGLNQYDLFQSDTFIAMENASWHQSAGILHIHMEI